MSRWTADATMLAKRAPNAAKLQWGALITYGPVTDEDRLASDSAGQEKLERVTVAVIPADAWVGLARGVTITKDAETQYKVRDFRALDDGMLLELYLAAVIS